MRRFTKFTRIEGLHRSNLQSSQAAGPSPTYLGRGRQSKKPHGRRGPQRSPPARQGLEPLRRRLGYVGRGAARQAQARQDEQEAQLKSCCDAASRTRYMLFLATWSACSVVHGPRLLCAWLVLTLVTAADQPRLAGAAALPRSMGAIDPLSLPLEVLRNIFMEVLCNI